MSKKAFSRLGKRARARLRAIHRKAAAWKSIAKRSLWLTLIAACTANTPSLALAQVGGMGQGAMTPAGGVVNRAVAGLQNLNANGPGLFYYGINAADRGLGYNGSYMTAGGFIPYAEDDLGGFWSADVRGHLSTYGGFFSNVGLVRKQFIGGALGGIGIYWDYDGDGSQYPTGGAGGTQQLGQFGHSYNQVGISSEFLTDWGNLRSNGYIPVGTTAYTAGNPGSAFYQNFVMSQYGLDTALSGADLEVGAYIPGLADWSGMVSVGGYALGNTQSRWTAGSKVGQSVVPWFGGVYTRLDMTIMENWDFSLQANNDSYFDWTGFARITYRMGGSRRRNVPDQMEQPMMRNEHIVRAHQTPDVAINPSTLTPWRVIHVNNAAAAGGDGSIENPFTTLAQGDTAATNPWDIVFVSYGTGTPAGYGTPFSFNQPNQSLIGDGAAFYFPSLSGPVNIATNSSGNLPLLSNPAGDSVFIDGAIAGGATVANLQITGSGVGIAGTGNLTGLPSILHPLGQPSWINNVTIAGNGTSAGQTGVSLVNPSGLIDFTETTISNMTQGGLVVDGGTANLVYQGTIASDTAFNGGASSPIVNIANTTGGSIRLAWGGTPTGSTIANAITDSGGQGIQLIGNSNLTVIEIGNISLTNTVGSAISLFNDSSVVSIVAGAGSGIAKDTGGSAISVDGGAPTLTYFGGISNAPAPLAGDSFLLTVANTTAGAVTLTAPPGSPFTDTGHGITISNAQGNVTVLGASIASSGAQGILIGNGSTGVFQFRDITITGATGAGVMIQNSTGPVTFTNLSIDLASTTATGFLADTAGDITATGANTITTASTVYPAVFINNAGTLAMSIGTVTTAVIAGTNSAMFFLGTTSGAFDVTSAFTVGGVQGTVPLDVTNPSTTVITVPPP